MKVGRITLRNFRNAEECVLDAHPHLNFLVGANGEGKTSVIEALGYLSTLHSFRDAKTDEVIQWGQSTAEVSCTLYEQDWQTQIKVIFSNSPKSQKIAFINDKPYRSSTQFLSQRFGHFKLGFHTVIFNPSDHDLVRGDPIIRRRYLNRVLSAEDEQYLQTLQRYNRVLEQRNAVLKNSIPPNKSLLAGFSETLAQYGAKLTLSRLRWLERLKSRIKRAAGQIAPLLPEIQVRYVSRWVPEIDGISICNDKLGSVHFSGLSSLPSLEILEQVFIKKLSATQEAEVKAKGTLIGPHRDDWMILLGSKPLKGHASQGEVRSALLALKLSEIELFRIYTQHRPVLLLDDFSSELDQERRAYLLRFLAETDLQVFITTTEMASELLANKVKDNLGRFFRVHRGKALLEKENHFEDSHQQQDLSYPQNVDKWIT